MSVASNIRKHIDTVKQFTELNNKFNELNNKFLELTTAENEYGCGLMDAINKAHERVDEKDHEFRHAIHELETSVEYLPNEDMIRDLITDGVNEEISYSNVVSDAIEEYLQNNPIADLLEGEDLTGNVDTDTILESADIEGYVQNALDHNIADSVEQVIANNPELIDGDNEHKGVQELSDRVDNLISDLHSVS